MASSAAEPLQRHPEGDAGLRRIRIRADGGRQLIERLIDLTGLLQQHAEVSARAFVTGILPQRLFVFVSGLVCASEACRSMPRL